MPNKIIILSGSPKKDGNTAMLVGWFSEEARARGARVKVVRAASLKSRNSGIPGTQYIIHWIGRRKTQLSNIAAIIL